VTSNVTNNTNINVGNTTVTNVNSNNRPTYNVTNTNIINEIDNTFTGAKKTFVNNSFDYKFYNLGKGRFAVKSKNGKDIDEITGVDNLSFDNKSVDITEVQETFDQVTGINDVSGVVFRLYNAAFARLPDSAGLKNWINANSSGKKSYKETAEAFADSQEFENRYGANVSNTEFVTTLYNNVLDRDPDANGLARYVGELNDGTNERKDLLYIFSESQENRGLFTDTTGLGWAWVDPKTLTSSNAATSVFLQSPFRATRYFNVGTTTAQQ